MKNRRINYIYSYSTPSYLQNELSHDAIGWNWKFHHFTPFYPFSLHRGVKHEKSPYKLYIFLFHSLIPTKWAITRQNMMNFRISWFYPPYPILPHKGVKNEKSPYKLYIFLFYSLIPSKWAIKRPWKIILKISCIWRWYAMVAILKGVKMGG